MLRTLAGVSLALSLLSSPALGAPTVGLSDDPIVPRAAPVAPIHRSERPDQVCGPLRDLLSSVARGGWKLLFLGGEKNGLSFNVYQTPSGWAFATVSQREEKFCLSGRGRHFHLWKPE